MKKLFLALALIFFAFPVIGHAEGNPCSNDRECPDSEQCNKRGPGGTCFDPVGIMP